MTAANDIGIFLLVSSCGILSQADAVVGDTTTNIMQANVYKLF